MSITRSISAILMLALAFALFIFGGYPLAGVLLIISLIGFWELSKAFANPAPEPGAERVPLPAKKKIDYLDIIGLITVAIYYVFSFLYCPVMLGFVYMTRESEPYGKYLIWMILISSWGCDTFAFLFGIAFGKKKIFPLLSPKKSLAGCIGGLISSAVIGGIYGYFYVMPALRKMKGTEGL